MTDIPRRDFLKSLGLLTGGLSLGGTALLTACSKQNKNTETDNKSNTDSKLAAIIISSDLYKSSEKQRFAFTIFSKDSIASAGEIPITLTSPSGKKQEFPQVPVREKGIKERGIFSFDPILDEQGIWELTTTFNETPLRLSAQVAEKSDAPAIGSTCPDVPTPTDSAPLDAKILCTRHEGNCGLHKFSVSELLPTGKPFAVIFATPARCQTRYCGPVLELARTIDTAIPIVHIEIFQDETSNNTLNAVEKWNLPSEPWFFGVNSEGIINARLDGAFDQSEMEDILKLL